MSPRLVIDRRKLGSALLKSSQTEGSSCSLPRARARDVKRGVVHLVLKKLKGTRCLWC